MSHMPLNPKIESVWSLDSIRQFNILNYFHETKANIICLQGNHCRNNDVKNVWQNWKGNCIFHCFSSNSRGLQYSLKKILSTKLPGNIRIKMEELLPWI